MQPSYRGLGEAPRFDNLRSRRRDYASFRDVPVVCGVDGVGLIDHGSRVFFAGPSRPFGAMAQRTVVGRARCFPISVGIDGLTAAFPNPGVSSWMSLAWRVQLAPGQTVLALGATGVTVGRPDRKAARRRTWVAAGRNQAALSTMPGFGADAIIPLDQSPQDLTDAFIREAKGTGFDIVIDYEEHTSELQSLR